MKCEALAVLVCAAGAWAQSQPATLSIESLRAGADAYWGSIQTLQVSCTSSMPGPIIDEVVRDHRSVITLKGDKVLYDHTYGGSPAFEGRISNRVYAYDGEVSTEQDTTNGGAFVTQGRADCVRLDRAPGFLDVSMMTTAGGSFGATPVYRSLLSVLNSPDAVLRPLIDDVDGHPCHVVDLYASSGQRWISIWIDTQRGFLPLRRVVWSTPGNQAFECKVDEAIMLPTGHWVPVRARGCDGVLPPLGEPPSASLTLMQVDRDASGSYVIAVNQPVDDSLFSLHEHIPQGFQVLDLTAKKAWIARGGDYDLAGQSNRSVIANSDLNLRRDGIPVQPLGTDESHSDARLVAAHAVSGLGGACIAAVIGIAFLKRRRAGA